FLCRQRYELGGLAGCSDAEQQTTLAAATSTLRIPGDKGVWEEAAGGRSHASAPPPRSWAADKLSAWQDPEHPASSGLPRCGLHDAPARRIKNSPPLGRPFSVICSVSCVFLPQDDPRCSSTVLVEKNAHVRAMTREGHGHKRSEVRAEILG
ncbi:unnamed protein product, partial [Prorocentrum cordatum]